MVCLVSKTRGSRVSRHYTLTRWIAAWYHFIRETLKALGKARNQSDFHWWGKGEVQSLLPNCSNTGWVALAFCWCKFLGTEHLEVTMDRMGLHSHWNVLGKKEKCNQGRQVTFSGVWNSAERQAQGEVFSLNSRKILVSYPVSVDVWQEIIQKSSNKKIIKNLSL